MLSWTHSLSSQTSFIPRTEKGATTSSLPLRISARTSYPTRYYYVDFVLSHLFPTDVAAPLLLVVIGGDKSIPEHNKLSLLHDPFEFNIYCLDNILREGSMKGSIGIRSFSDHSQHRRDLRKHVMLRFAKPLVDDSCLCSVGTTAWLCPSVGPALSRRVQGGMVYTKAGSCFLSHLPHDDLGRNANSCSHYSWRIW
ncbi:hypothetical protein BD309DRAFT_358363 [Dichomitus squalens]|uniref:Uncharacterized protein n=1 Tax=Dichomitus squalens TaxID=114155 RepID=A0A4Q9MUT9_9APHY|nr:hypothetical protein BD311DRAFT_101375 [Dichomitus squalens]TBU48098.1 hypothetical protein BD309DRAFT_358363 [Dichomitus squalens]TBU64379.1 hypothetical protein BD310DRAFT_395088 [Dichomitus squalens]